MRRSLRALVLGLAWAAAQAGTARAREAEAPPASRREDPPPAFVPLHPRTEQERDRLEALQLYTAARALEDRRRWTDAIELLERALGKDPDSVAIPRRLSRLCFALGRTDQAIAYGRKVVEADPRDAETIRLLVTYYRSRGDLAAAETLLRGALAHPELGSRSPAALVIRHDLGLLLAAQEKFDQAAEALAPLVEALDDRAVNQFSPAEQRLILGADEAETYRKLGVVFLAARRTTLASSKQRADLAVTAFRRGLVYEPDNAELPRLLARALVQAGRPAEALEVLEPVLKGHPRGRDDYDVLAEILTALNRPGAIIPRLEAAAQADPKNSELQYALADRYREAGRLADANRLYKQLLALQADPEGFAARSESLRKAGRIEDLLKLFETALEGNSRRQAVLLQIEAIGTDPAAADAILAAGLKLLEATPPRLGPLGREVLVLIARRAKKPEAQIALGRLAVRRDPTTQTYLELYQTLGREGRYEEAAATLQELLERFPEQKSPLVLGSLGVSWFQAGQNEKALEAARAVLALDPNDLSALQLVGSALSRLGRYTEAIAHYQSLLERMAGSEEAVRLAHSGLSNVYVAAGELDKAEAELEGLLEKAPDDAGINNDLGYLYADRGKDLEKAEAMIRKAVQEEPTNGAYLDSLGWVLLKRGKAREALDPLEKAVQELGSDPTLYDHLGDVYFQLQEFRKARDAWQKAEALATKAIPPDKRLAEIRKKLEALKALGPPPPTTAGDNP